MDRFHLIISALIALCVTQLSGTDARRVWQLDQPDTNNRTGKRKSNNKHF